MRIEAKTFVLSQILATNKQNSHFAITQSTHSLYGKFYDRKRYSHKICCCHAEAEHATLGNEKLG